MVRQLTMKRHDTRLLPRRISQTDADADGRLFDPAIRRAHAEMGRGIRLEDFEALAAVRLVAKRMHDEFQGWTERHGLSESGFRVMMAIFHSPHRRLPLGAVAERLNVVPRTITDVVDVLERADLVRRVPDPADRRSVHAELTKAGVKRLAAIKRSAMSQQAALTRGFTRDQLAELRHLCMLLVKNLNDNPGGA
jgi:DNA-binding MarR family transcriptional regulator